MTIRRRCIEVLEEGPATTREIALEVLGDESARSLNRVASHIRKLRRHGAPLKRAGQLPGRGGHPLNLWAIDEGGM